MTYQLLQTYEKNISKSKFITYLYEISQIEQYKIILKDLQKEHKKASHICVAARLNDEILIKNDSEVGQPAQTMLNILEHHELNSHILFCVRYFGGVKLGVGGVSRAFKEVSQECIKNYLDNKS